MSGKNEGEGNRTAARRYNEHARETAERDVHEDAEPESKEQQEEMERAEREGREHAKEVDPAVDRDYQKPTR